MCPKPGDLKLPPPEPDVFGPVSIPRIDHILWRIDPPYIEKLGPDWWINVATAAFNYHIKVAEAHVTALKEIAAATRLKIR